MATTTMRPTMRPIARSTSFLRAPALRPLRVSALRAVAPAMQAKLDWSSLTRGHSPPGEWEMRHGAVPSSSPSPSLPTTKESIDASESTILFRDTNAWCPFCERVWFALLEKGVPFETVFINLGAKPDWYKEMVPTALTPAAKVNGKIVWESMVILDALEAAHPQPALLPLNPDLAASAKSLMAACDNQGVGSAGYMFLLGRPFGADSATPSPPVEELKAVFESKLAAIEEALGVCDGPWFMPEFSLVDIAYTPSLERMAVLLPHKRGFALRGNPKYPRLSAWFDALESRPAYQAVRTDAETHIQLSKRRFRMDMPVAPSARTPGQLEAGSKLAANHSAVVADVLKNAGLLPGGDDSAHQTFVASVVELTVYNLAAHLLGTPPQVADAPADEDEPAKKARVARTSAVTAATLAFLRCRVTSPRDMRASGAEAFRAAADALLVEAYCQ
ncbi:hypothetical protein FOA52_002102 [Chlamydomonas sp. UWO 241]|nr:hypothetical protein FOA52_002102 [Chlamydomonas sp. UWO 241]